MKGGLPPQPPLLRFRLMPARPPSPPNRGARLTASSIFWVYLLGMFLIISVVRLSSPARIFCRSRLYSFSCAGGKKGGGGAGVKEE